MFESLFFECWIESWWTKNGLHTGEWRRMSLPAMLLGETVVEILQASHFAKEVVSASAKLPKTKTTTDPKTPDTIHRNKKLRCENTELRARRMKEKQVVSRAIRSESGSPKLTRARSRIRFKSTSPLSKREDRSNGGRPSVTVNRVSPKNRPWAKKAVLFPNPLFLPSSSISTSSSNKQRFYKTKSPIISRTRQQTPHKFTIKSPPTSLKSQLKSKKAVPAVAPNSPTEKVVVPKPRRCSFSPSKLASRLISPIRTRISLQKSSSGLMSGLKQRSNFSTPVRISSTRRIWEPF